MFDFFLCLCNSVYIFWKSLPAHHNASDNPVFETCNFFVCVIFAMPVEGHRHFVALHLCSVYWPCFDSFHPSSFCYTQKVPTIICQPPTKLHGVTHHNAKYFLYRHTSRVALSIAYKASNRRYLPYSLSTDAPSCSTKRSLLSVAVLFAVCYKLACAERCCSVSRCQSSILSISHQVPSSAQSYSQPIH